MSASALFSTGKVRMILPHAMIFIAQRQAKCNRQNIRCRAYQFYNRVPHQDRFIGLPTVLYKSLRSSFWQFYATNTHLTRHYFYQNVRELISPKSAG
jgi:hypothetical protein